MTLGGECFGKERGETEHQCAVAVDGSGGNGLGNVKGSGCGRAREGVIGERRSVFEHRIAMNPHLDRVVFVVSHELAVIDTHVLHT
jgi:hypothetical protein